MQSDLLAMSDGLMVMPTTAAAHVFLRVRLFMAAPVSTKGQPT